MVKYIFFNAMRFALCPMGFFLEPVTGYQKPETGDFEY
jgi:hypothetical protein